MNIKFSLLFSLLGISNLFPLSLSAVTIEELNEAIKMSHACPIENIDLQ